MFSNNALGHLELLHIASMVSSPLLDTNTTGCGQGRQWGRGGNGTYGVAGLQKPKPTSGRPSWQTKPEQDSELLKFMRCSLSILHWKQDV